MKKQISRTIKEHRSASYLHLMLAVCAIPFAFVQRNSFKQSTKSQKVLAILPQSLESVGDSDMPDFSEPSNFPGQVT